MDGVGWGGELSVPKTKPVADADLMMCVVLCCVLFCFVCLFFLPFFPSLSFFLASGPTLPLLRRGAIDNSGDGLERLDGLLLEHRIQETGAGGDKAEVRPLDGRQSCFTTKGRPSGAGSGALTLGLTTCDWYSAWNCVPAES